MSTKFFRTSEYALCSASSKLMKTPRMHVIVPIKWGEITHGVIEALKIDLWQHGPDPFSPIGMGILKSDYSNRLLFSRDQETARC